VIGGGVFGASVAYHLTRLGVRDVLLLERRSLTCGTTWHAAGLIGRLRGTRTASRLVDDSARLYARLPEETGQATGWKRCGSLVVARTTERLHQLRRYVALGQAVGIEAHIVSAGEAGLLFGGFEPQAKPCPDQPIPEDFAFSLFKEDWDQFEVLMRGTAERIPVLESAEIQLLLNGPESFTPDGNFVLGEAPALRGYFI